MDGRRVRIVYRWVAVALSTFAALVVIELVLRWQQSVLARSDQLDPGLIRPDPELGWVLTPGWQGRHRHHDFEVRYQVGGHGFRADTEWPVGREGRWIAVLGDSFTFGLGVNDDQTFIHQLGRISTNRFVNCAVPGYSTDQQALLAEREVLKLRPTVLLLVVYLGNDLFDNQLGMPLQVNVPKPRFAWSNSSLVIIPPAPAAEASSASSRPTLLEFVLGIEYSRSWRARLENRSQLFRQVSERVGPTPASLDDFPVRAQPALELTWRIIERVNQACATNDVGLVVALLAGRSWLETPGSVSGRFQEHLRVELARKLDSGGVPTIDLCSLLREAIGSQPDRLYYPRDGHLTPAGHRVIAEILAERIVAPTALPPRLLSP